MNLENIIKIFDEYANKNRMFNHYRQKVNDFIRIHPLKKILTYTQDNIYLAGEKGRDSFIKAICNEELMGTRVGAIFSTYGGFFNKSYSLEDFKKFIGALISLDITNFYTSFRSTVLDGNYFNDIFTLKTSLIQILATYFPDYFLPIYNKKMLLQIIKDFDIELNDLDVEKEKILQSNKKEDFFERVLISDELLFEKKNNHEIMKHWDNILFSHFLFMCLPVDVIGAFEKLGLGVRFIEPNEQFLVGLFSRAIEKLGFKYYTKLKTSFPDAEVEDQEGRIMNVEFEFNSSSFIGHEHDPELCDLIICWHDDIKSDWKREHPKIDVIAFEDIRDVDSDLYQKLAFS